MGTLTRNGLVMKKIRRNLSFSNFTGSCTNLNQLDCFCIVVFSKLLSSSKLEQVLKLL